MRTQARSRQAGSLMPPASESSLAWTAFASDLGWIGVLFSEPSLHGVLLGQKSLDDVRSKWEGVAKEVRRPRDERVDRLKAYAEGEEVDFAGIELDIDAVSSPFHRQVYHACRKIPYGQTCSYAELALAAGSKNAARAVGQAMAGNRWPIIVPCHRVVRAGGKLGGFTSPAGTSLKQLMLDREQMLVR